MDYVHPFSSTKNHHFLRSAGLGRCISLLACSQPLRSASRMLPWHPPRVIFGAAPRRRPRSLETNRAAKCGVLTVKDRVLTVKNMEFGPNMDHKKARFDLLKHVIYLKMKHGDLNVKHVDLTIKHLQLTIQRMTYE